MEPTKPVEEIFQATMPETKEESEADERTRVLLEQFRKARHLSKDESAAYTNELNRLPEHLKLPENQASNPGLMADVFTLASLEEEFDIINREQISKMNRCSLSEYGNRWVFLHLLFEHSGCSTRTEYKKKRRELSQEYIVRFSPQHNIVIYDDYDPTNVIAVIPAMYRPMQTIRGNATDAINAFSNFGASDRPDIQAAVTHNLMQATINAQRVEATDLEMHQARTYEAMIKVLECFNPDHPLVKSHHESISNTSEPDQTTKNVSVSSGLDLEGVSDIDLEDFGL